MPTGARFQRNSSPRSCGGPSLPILACCALLSLCCHSTPAATLPNNSNTPTRSSTTADQDTAPPASLLDAWDQAEQSLRQTVWSVYAATAAFGQDSRGRTLEDDLQSAVMPPDTRAQLIAAHAKCEQQLQSGDTHGAQATWTAAKTLLEEQSQHLAVITLYWTERTHLERLRALWLHWVNQAPNDVATASRSRIDRLVRQQTSDFAPTADLNTVQKDLNDLKIAYDQERHTLAAQLSAKAFSAGQKIASRERTLSCTPPPGARDTGPVAAASTDPQSHPDAKTSPQRPPKLLTSPSAEEFYPSEDRRDSISGDVIVQVTVGTDGCMTHADVTVSSGAPELDDRALELVERATFLPAQTQGRFVEAQSHVKYHFILGGDAPGATPPTEATPPMNAASLITRGNQLMDRGSLDEALADFNQAITLEPHNATAIADRGMVYVWKRDPDRARSDLDQAYALDPNNPIVFHGRGVQASLAGNPSEAIAAFTVALAQNAEDSFALQWRAEAYQAIGEFQHAFDDNTELLRLRPRQTPLYYRLALLLRAQHKMEQALQQAQAIVTDNPQDPQAALNAGFIYAASNKPEEAMRSFDRAIELGGGEHAYLSRAQHRPRADLAGRQADIDAALKLNPKSIAATELLADLQSESGDPTTAITTLDNALAAKPDDDTLLIHRAILYSKSHQDTQATADLDNVTAHATTAQKLNNLCWSLATARVELERASQACTAALAQVPDQSAYLDSQAFVFLQLGRNAEAITTYDKALEHRPLSPMSLYGRGLAKRRQGDTPGATTDIQYALLLDARTPDTFARYNIDP